MLDSHRNGFTQLNNVSGTDCLWRCDANTDADFCNDCKTPSDIGLLVNKGSTPIIPEQSPSKLIHLEGLFKI